MDHNDLKLYITLAETVRDAMVVQSQTAKAIWARQDSVESFLKLRAELDRDPDTQEIIKLREELEQLARAHFSKNAADSQEFFDYVARNEMLNERFEAFIADLKKLLPPEGK